MENINEMSIADYVSRYNVFRQGDRIGSRFWIGPDKDEAMAYGKNHKQEILAYLIEQEAAVQKVKDERQAKIDAIPGLKELTAAYDEMLNWREELHENIERGDSGVGIPPKPEHDFEALAKQYPRAAAYLAADAMCYASHDVKAAAGQEAKERIINGDDPDEALAEANEKWLTYCREHMWD